MSGRWFGNRRWGIAFKLSLFILASAACIFLVAFGYHYVSSRTLVLKSVEENTRNLSLATVNRMETVLAGVHQLTQYLALTLEQKNPGREDLLRSIRHVLTTNPDIFGCAVAFEPYRFDTRLRKFSPYTYRYEKGLKTVYPEKNVEYFDMDWYRIPRDLGWAVWSEPYFDEAGAKISMATFTVPFYRDVQGRRTFCGVVIADMSLEWLVNIVSRVSIYETGYAFLISRKGFFITHPNKDWVMRESIFSLAKKIGEPSLERIGRDMVDGNEGFVPFRGDGEDRRSRLYYAPLVSSRWSMGIVIPEGELFGGIHQLSREVLWIGAAGFVVLLLVVVVTASTITKPLRALASKTHDIARGNLDIELPRKESRDEVGELTTSFEGMRLALKEYIAHLRETTAAKERIESELKIARSIQMSFLPKRFPPFPEKVEFDIFATLEPAREVGGDLYDFFLLDEDHLFFSIGDVSGKGVPAALFMAVAKILMKGHAGKDMDPSDILHGANRELCRDNETMMFVTVFCGILHLPTGDVRYSNAGHNPPLAIRHRDGVRRIEWVEPPPGVFLGIEENAEFRTEVMRLAPGDALLLYTDGVTEAMDRDLRVYSEQRLWQFVSASVAETAEDLVRGVMGSVRTFTAAEPQSDDITVLCLRYAGRGAT